MLDIRMFESSDADILCPDAIDKSLQKNEVLWKAWAKVNARSGPAYTAVTDTGELIAAAGIRLVREGVGNVWMVMSPKVSGYKKAVLRWLKTMIPIIMEEFGLKKLRTDSRKGFAASQRLLEHIGFKRLRKETKTNYFYILEV